MPTVTVSLWQSAVDDLLGFVDNVGQYAEIQSKTLLPPAANTLEQRLKFTTIHQIDKMAFVSKNGATTFDSVGVETVVDSFAYMAFIPNITSEMYVLFDDSRYRIVSVEDIGKINGIYKLTLQLSGFELKAAAK